MIEESQKIREITEDDDTNKVSSETQTTTSTLSFEIEPPCEIIEEDKEYEISYDAETITVYFKGELALGGAKEYEPIKTLLNKIVVKEPPTMTLNLEALEFCNSSGISMLSKFVLGLRKQKGIKVLVLGSHEIPWQGKSLQNLTKLLPTRLTLKLSGGEED